MYIILPLIILEIFITRMLYMGYKGKGINPLSVKNVRSIFALLNIIYIAVLILLLPLAIMFDGNNGILAQFVLACFMLFAIIQFFLITNK